MHFLRSVATVLLFTPLLSFGQSRPSDVLDGALISTFQRDNGKLVCVSTHASLKQMRDTIAPYIKGIDLADQKSYPTVVAAVYQAFPCPFSSSRPELRPAETKDLIGTWIFPDASLKFRHGPQSPSWQTLPGVPHIKCEGISLYESGEYRVAQIRGAEATCPTLSSMHAMRALPQVSSWSLLSSGRIRIDRTDAPTHFEEWEVFSVQTPFEFYLVKFSTGDLVAYFRRAPGNEINAAAAFRHLQPLK